MLASRRATRARKWLPWLFVLCALVLGPLFLAATRGDPALDVNLPPAVTKALTAAAPYLAKSSRVATKLLQQIGFNDSVLPENARRLLPPVNQIEAAYISAEKKKPGSGEVLLALLSKALAQEYESASLHPALQPYLTRDVPAGKLEFEPLKPADLEPKNLPKFTAEATDALSALARYCEGGGISVRSVLIEYFGLSPEKANEVIRTWQTVDEILKHGIAPLSEIDRDRAMTRLVGELDSSYESAPSVKEFAPWRPKDQADPAALPAPFRWHEPGEPGSWDPGFGPRRPAPPGMPPEKPSGGGVGEVPPRVDPPGGKSIRPPVAPAPAEVRERWQGYRAREYKDFVRQSYGGPRAGRFIRVLGSAGGFGGVVFGNKVIDAELPVPVELTWVPDGAGAAEGKLVCRFGDRSATLENVSKEDAYAAHLIVYRGVGKPDDENRVEPVASIDEAIGLVGIHDAVPYYDCGPEGITHEGRRWKVVMHPALADLRLGWSTLMCDVLPLTGETGVLLRRVAARDKDAAADLREAFERGETYKFSDVPLQVNVRDGRLLVQRPEEPGLGANEEVRASAFLTFTPYSGGKAVAKDDPYYKLIPALTRSSADYERLNNFARVLTVYRWAKFKGLKETPAPPAPDPAPTGASVVVTDAGAVPAPDFHRLQAFQELRDKIGLRLAALRLESDEVRELGEKYRNESRLSDELWQVLKRIQEIAREFDDEEKITQMAQKAGQDTADRYRDLVRKIEEQRRSLDEPSDDTGKPLLAERRYEQLTDERREFLVKTFPPFQKLSAEATELGEKAEKLSERLDELRAKSSSPEDLLSEIIRRRPAEAEKAGLGEAEAKLKESREALRHAREAVDQAEKTLSSLLDDKGRPKAAPPEVLKEYDGLLADWVRAMEKGFDEKASKGDKDKAKVERESAAKKIVEFEEKRFPEITKQRTAVREAIEKRDTAKLDSDRILLRRDELCRKLCPAARYWQELRDRREKLNSLLSGDLFDLD